MYIEKQPIPDGIDPGKEAGKEEENLGPRMPPVSVDLQDCEEKPTSRRDDRHES
jgi:hypothetical protein